MRTKSSLRNPDENDDFGMNYSSTSRKPAEAGDQVVGCIRWASGLGRTVAGLVFDTPRLGSGGSLPLQILATFIEHVFLNKNLTATIFEGS